MPSPKTDAKASNDAASKKARTKPAKVKAETVMPEGLVVQVHERKTPPEGYRICNGTTFGTYQSTPWGR